MHLDTRRGLSCPCRDAPRAGRCLKTSYGRLCTELIRKTKTTQVYVVPTVDVVSLRPLVIVPRSQHTRKLFYQFDTWPQFREAVQKSGSGKSAKWTNSVRPTALEAIEFCAS